MGTFVSPVPEESPAFLRGYPLNSTAIHISWNGLPPSRHKEQLLGYRVRYRRLGSLLYEEANTSGNVTEIVVLNLVTQTKYEIKINGFNEIGHGPTSKILVIKTLSSGKSEMIALFLIQAEYYIIFLSLILPLLTNSILPSFFYSAMTSSSLPVVVFVSLLFLLFFFCFISR